MTEEGQIYRCSVCGNTIKIIESGAGQLVCCGQPMDLEEDREEE